MNLLTLNATIEATMTRIDAMTAATATAVRRQANATGTILVNAQRAAGRTNDVSGAIAGVSRAAVEVGAAGGAGLDAPRPGCPPSGPVEQKVGWFIVGPPAA